jgi:methyl-accepting chemotaxis protein
MVQITVQILDILATAIKVMKQGRLSEFDLRLAFLEVNIGSEKFLDRVAGRTRLEDGMKKLDKLIGEEVAMAIAEQAKVTYNIDKNVTQVKGEVQLANDNLELGNDIVIAVNNNVNAVNDNVNAVNVNVNTVNNNVNTVNNNVNTVNNNVNTVNDNVKGVGNMVQRLADGGQCLSGESLASYLNLII